MTYTNKTLPVLLKDPKILLVGGGKAAYQKAEVLKLNNIDFQIISTEICREIKCLNVNFILKIFDEHDLKNFNIVINATGNKDVNILLKKLKEKKFFLLNSVDVPEDCDFYFSSLLVYKNLKIAVSSNGASPSLTKIIRDKIKGLIPPEVGNIAEKKLAERENGIISTEKIKEETNSLFGKVFLIGCGPGSADLLTLEAYKAIQSVDVVLYDNLITEEILEIVPVNTEKIFTGKCKGGHSISQGEINDILLNYARRGFRVARLKNGDPFVFGRGAEEAEFLIRNNVEVKIITGISSAFAAPFSAGIPVTARGYSSSVSVVTVHLQGGTFNSDWIDLLKLKNHTTIVLMGLTMVGEITEQAMLSHVSVDLPAAIISKATTQDQKIFVTNLESLVETAELAERPAVIVFGEVVKFSGLLKNVCSSIEAELNFTR